MLEMRRLVLALALLWPVVGLADYWEGWEAYQRGDFATAMREWRPLAEAGDAEAQGNLGIMYADGTGVPEDDAEAVRWYRKAAQQGVAEAQTRLGVMYANGEGVPEDSVQAYAWFNLAAVQDNKAAQDNKDVVRKKMTPAQIAEAEKLSRKLCAKIPSCAK